MSNSLQRIFCIGITFGLILFSVAFVQAGDMTKEQMLQVVQQRLEDPGALQAAIEAGEDRALFCKYCHGTDGNSLKPEVPNLAGQNASYLLDQIQKFATRQRDDYVMSSLAENFSAEDKINLAIFYYSQHVKAHSVDAKLAAKGKPLFTTVCSSCHGVEGHGNQQLARLAGQQIGYVTNALKAFRDNANNPAARAAASRRSDVMEGVVKGLTDEQIAAVAAYVAILP